MNDTVILEIAAEAMMAAAKLAAPVLRTSLAVGLFMGLLQSATHQLERIRNALANPASPQN